MRSCTRNCCVIEILSLLFSKRMGRAGNVLLLLFLLCFVAMNATAERMADEELGLSSSPTKHEHRHSGLSAADCPDACQYRCSKTAYKKPCLFYCQKCCYTCRCVPPGTYANKAKCPCYNNWKTKRGGPKCP